MSGRSGVEPLSGAAATQSHALRSVPSPTSGFESPPGVPSDAPLATPVAATLPALTASGSGLSRRLRSALSLLAIAGVTGCVYFNGIYNAREAASRGDSRLRRGDESGAGPFFSASAESAESVLARHPTSKWTSTALYLAGRGAAYSGLCDRGISRLDEYLATLPDGADSGDVARARVARAMCMLRVGKVDTARLLLDALIAVSDKETSRQARLWAARAALARRDGEAAARYLEGLEIGTMAWELISSAVAARDFSRAESLLVERAREADYRDDVVNALRELLNTGDYRTAERIIGSYDRTRVPDRARVTMHFLIGDYAVRDGFDTVAAKHLAVVQRLAGRDTSMAREAAARLTLLELRQLDRMSDVDSVLANEDSTVARTPFARRTAEQFLFVRLLAGQEEDPTGAKAFVAAEAARDSLKAFPLARAIFLRIADDHPFSPVAPGALYAASLLTPDSASVWKERILTRNPSSNVAAWLRGEDPASAEDFRSNRIALDDAWQDAIRIWADTLRKIRAAQAVEARTRR